MGLADAEAAVQVVAAGGRSGPAEQALARRGGDPLGEPGQRAHGGLLARFGRVGPVGLEPRGVEPRRRHQTGDQFVGADDRIAVNQMSHGHEG